MNQDIKVAVIGGTGKAGKYLVKRLVSQGFKIKALTRNPGKLEETELVEKVTGDVTDYESVYNLVNGCEAVISRSRRPGEPSLSFHWRRPVHRC